MAHEFKLQDPGEGIQEAEIRQVLVAAGDEVNEGDHVLVVETDKAAVEIPAPRSGRIESVEVEEGELAQVGDVLITFADDGKNAGKEGGKNAETAEAAADEEERAEENEAEEERTGEAAGNEQTKAEQAQEEQAGEERSGEAETGRRKTGEEDEHPESGKSRETQPDEERETAETGEAEDREEKRQSTDGPRPATPATRRIARQLGVSIGDVAPSGRDGRVTEKDVRAFAGEEPASETAPGKKPARAPPALPDFSQWGEVERQPLRSVRRTIANRMAEAWARVPHVTHHDLVDVTELDAFRRRHQEEIETEGTKLTLSVFILKAAVAALSEHPRFNASLDAEAGEIILKRYYHVGVAIDTERGLTVPVIRDVDRKNVIELAAEMSDLAGRTRSGHVPRDEMKGGTFTVTNVGSLGGANFTPIVNFPEVAILGAGRAELRPVVRGDLDSYEMTPRLMLPLSLAFDHRVNDGADAARFMNTVLKGLTDPEEFALMV